MMMHSWKSPRITITAIALFVLFSQQLMAQSEVEDDAWNHSLAVYLWGSGIKGTTAQGAEVEVSFQDIAENLDFGAMAAYSARKGKWSLLTDVIYLDIAADEQLDLIPPVGGSFINVTTDANLDLTGWVVHLVGGYNLYDDREGTTTDVTFGVRYLDLSMDLLFDFDLGSPELDVTLPLSESGDVWDAIVGLRGNISLGPRWFVPWGANIGAGDSDLTWQAIAGVGYKAASWADVVLTYRYLKWELDGELIDELSFSGPMLGAVFRF